MLVISVTGENFRRLVWFLLIQVRESLLFSLALQRMEMLSPRDTERKAGDWVNTVLLLAAEKGNGSRHKATSISLIPPHIPPSCRAALVLQPESTWDSEGRPWARDPETLGSPQVGRENSHHLREVPCIPLLTWEPEEQKAEEQLSAPMFNPGCARGCPLHRIAQQPFS